MQMTVGGCNDCQLLRYSSTALIRSTLLFITGKGRVVCKGNEKWMKWVICFDGSSPQPASCKIYFLLSIHVLFCPSSTDQCEGPFLGINLLSHSESESLFLYVYTIKYYYYVSNSAGFYEGGQISFIMLSTDWQHLTGSSSLALDLADWGSTFQINEFCISFPVEAWRRSGQHSWITAGKSWVQSGMPSVTAGVLQKEALSAPEQKCSSRTTLRSELNIRADPVSYLPTAGAWQIRSLYWRSFKCVLSCCSQAFGKESKALARQRQSPNPPSAPPSGPLAQDRCWCSQGRHWVNMWGYQTKGSVGIHCPLGRSHRRPISTTRLSGGHRNKTKSRRQWFCRSFTLLGDEAVGKNMAAEDASEW